MKYIKEYATQAEFDSALKSTSQSNTLSFQEEGKVLRLFGKNDSVDAKCVALAKSGYTMTMVANAVRDQILGRGDAPFECDFNGNGVVAVDDLTWVVDRRELFYHKYSELSHEVTKEGDIVTVNYKYITIRDIDIEEDLPVMCPDDIDEMTVTSHDGKYDDDYNVYDATYHPTPKNTTAIIVNGQELELQFVSSSSLGDYLRGRKYDSDGTTIMIQAKVTDTEVIVRYFDGSMVDDPLSSLVVKYNDVEDVR